MPAALAAHSTHTTHVPLDSPPAGSGTDNSVNDAFDVNPLVTSTTVLVDALPLVQLAACSNRIVRTDAASSPLPVTTTVPPAVLAGNSDGEKLDTDPGMQ